MDFLIGSSISNKVKEIQLDRGYCFGQQKCHTNKLKFNLRISSQTKESQESRAVVLNRGAAAH
jgi:hypothetical protein